MRLDDFLPSEDGVVAVMSNGTDDVSETIRVGEAEDLLTALQYAIRKAREMGAK